jgi:hypothetical protein
VSAWRDDFDGPGLDTSVWLPHYLPAWTSKAETAASYHLRDSCLVLDIPVDHPVWCPEEHDPPLRVSGLMSGNFSGPVGSTVGQQPVFPGQRVREEQERFEGFLPTGGHLGIRCRMDLSPRSMAALWLAGFEDEPERAGEICVVEIFGSSVRDGGCEVGVGLKRLRDPHLAEDFDAPRLPLDPAEMHTYAVDWGPDEAVFTVDDAVVRRCARPPTYPLQLMLAVFDFPAWSTGGDDHLVPSMTVDWVGAWIGQESGTTVPALCKRSTMPKVSSVP